MLPNPKKPKVPAWMGNVKKHKGKQWAQIRTNVCEVNLLDVIKTLMLKCSLIFKADKVVCRKNLPQFPEDLRPLCIHSIGLSTTPRHAPTTGADERKNFMVNGNLVRMAPNSQMTIPGRQQYTCTKVATDVGRLMGREQQGQALMVDRGEGIAQMKRAKPDPDFIFDFDGG